MQSELFQRTLKTVAMMVGACVAFTGLVTLLALFVVGRAVGPRESLDTPSLIPASKIDPQRPAKTEDTPPPPSNANKADLPPRATRAI